MYDGSTYILRVFTPDTCRFVQLYFQHMRLTRAAAIVSAGVMASALSANDGAILSPWFSRSRMCKESRKKGLKQIRTTK